MIRKQFKLLIAEDSYVLRHALQRLQNLSDASKSPFASMDFVSNGREAVDAVSRGDYDLVVLDFDMPVMNGLEALGLIRKMRPSIKVLIYSGSLQAYGFSPRISAQELANSHSVSVLLKGYLSLSDLMKACEQMLVADFSEELPYLIHPNNS